MMTAGAVIIAFAVGCGRPLAIDDAADGGARSPDASGPVSGPEVSKPKDPTYVELSAVQRFDQVFRASIAIDGAGRRVFVGIYQSFEGGLGAGLFQCDFAGQTCAYATIVAPNPGLETIAFDARNQGVWIVASGGAAPGASLPVVRCDVGGTACTPQEAAAATTYGHGSPHILADESNVRVLVGATDIATRRATLSVCPSDGSSCSYRDVSAGRGDDTGLLPALVVDTESRKVIVVTRDEANGHRPAVVICDLDGTNCAYRDVSLGRSFAAAGDWPAVAIDRLNKKLLVVVGNADGGRPSLFRCSLDGTDCLFADLSADQGDNSGIRPYVFVDAETRKLLVVTQLARGGAGAGFFRCELDGSSCSYVDVSSGRSGGTYSAAFDAPSGTLFITSGSSARPLGLYIVPTR